MHGGGSRVSNGSSEQSRVRQFFTNLGLRGLIGLALLMPYRYRIPFMGWLSARVVGPIAGYDKRVRNNLNTVFPDLPEDEVEKIVREVLDNFGRTLIEIYSGEEFTKRARNAPVTGPGLQDLEQALEKGRPIVLIGAHFGNYEAARTKLISLGCELGLLYRPLRNVYFNEHYVRSMKVIGERLFEQSRHGIKEMLSHLKSGGAIAVFTDLHSVDGVPMDFFEKPARTTLNMAKLALKHDAVMLPFYGRRAENGLDFEVILSSAVPHQSPRLMMLALTRDLEERIKHDMSQWFWVHRRWKI